MQRGRYTHTLDRITIDASNAMIGMYVSKLDRPWLETPFLFQGFEIKERKELELLKQYCSEITVDVSRGTLTPAQIRTLLATRASASKKNGKRRAAKRKSEPGKLARWFRNQLLRYRLLGRRKRASKLEDEGYTVTSTVRGEARRAFAAYVSICRAYERARLSALQHGKIVRQTLEPAVSSVVESILRNPDATAWTVFSRRQGVRANDRAVGTAVWCVMFGRHLAFDRHLLHELAIGGLLLDIGNVRLPPDLAEHEGDVSEEEFSWLAQHVNYGVDLLVRSGGFSRNIIDMVAHHHERADGSGYPEGRQGVAIPAFARIAGIADTFDAMTSENAYSPAYAAFDVSRALHEMSGELFDAEVVKQFLRTVGMFPTASVVELSNGQIGLVIEQSRRHALRPKVMILRDAERAPLPRPQIVELADLPPDAAQPKAVWIVQGHEHGAFGIDPRDYFAPRQPQQGLHLRHHGHERANG